MSNSTDIPKMPPEAAAENAPSTEPLLSIVDIEPRISLDQIAQLKPANGDSTLQENFGTPVISPDASIRTKINGKEFEIKNDSTGAPTQFTDKSGTWIRQLGPDQRPTDTYITGNRDQPFVRRGTPSIDDRGNFSFADKDSGVTTRNLVDGSTLVSMHDKDGRLFELGKDARGNPNYFRDVRGQWTSTDGTNWTNIKTGDRLKGNAALSQSGEFSFISTDKNKPGDSVSALSAEREILKELQEEIKNKFGVSIVPPGQKLESGRTGLPTPDELKSLKDTLERTKHVDYNNVQVAFIRPGTTNNSIQGQYGEYEDNVLTIFPKGRINPDSWIGAKGVGLHEFAHHEQSKIFKSDEWRNPKGEPALQKLIKDMGWVYDQKYGPLFQDKNGGLWQGREDSDDDPSKKPVDKAWRWIKGTFPEDGKTRITKDEMQDRALVRPATSYNTYPYETHAEGIALYRMAPERLASEAPETYKIMRDWDQSRIDARFGEGKFLRNERGYIVENTPLNREARREMELRHAIK